MVTRTCQTGSPLSSFLCHSLFTHFGQLKNDIHLRINHDTSFKISYAERLICVCCCSLLIFSVSTHNFRIRGLQSHSRLYLSTLLICARYQHSAKFTLRSHGGASTLQTFAVLYEKNRLLLFNRSVISYKTVAINFGSLVTPFRMITSLFAINLFVTEAENNREVITCFMMMMVNARMWSSNVQGGEKLVLKRLFSIPYVSLLDLTHTAR